MRLGANTGDGLPGDKYMCVCVCVCVCVFVCDTFQEKSMHSKWFLLLCI